MGDERVDIQIQDGGTWRTIHNTVNNAQIILNEMNNLKNVHPDKRVRAVDNNGHIVDIM
jgi:hypothetical protein